MFSHLHVHSEYSLLNGAIRVKDLTKRAKDLEMPAVAMTDYGALFGAVELCQQAEKSEIKPIIGCEVFLPSYDDFRLRQYKRGQDHYYHLVLLVQNEIGYKNLCHMLSDAYLEGFYYKPRVDTSLLEKYNEGLIALSAGFDSEINTHLYNEDRARAVVAAQKYAKIFPNRYYVELQDNEIPVQKEMNQELIQIAKESGLPVVATNNVHYLDRDDAGAFEVLRGVQLGRNVYLPQDSLKFSTDGYHFKNQDEMAVDFAHCPEALSITQDIVDQCNFGFTYGKYHLPNYEVPKGQTLDQFLEHEARQGLENRWPKIQKLNDVKDEDRPKYEARLTHELKVINGMGFPGYFLIVMDFIKWGKDNDIPVGPGRGSGAGSLVAYCLKITDIDPLPYNLLFERFLNPERVSMPDFDIDFCQDRRGEVIEYVNQKYGNVCQIITFGKMKAKAVIRDVGRVMDLEYDFVDKIAKLIPNALNITLTDALDMEPDLNKLYKSDETVGRLIDTSLKLEGLNRHASVHAAGVIITDKPLWNFAPLYKGSKDDVVVQYEMKAAEKIGLIKFDFLGLKTLTVIHKAVNNVKKSRDITIAIDEIAMDDKAVFESLMSGDGCGIFQLESSGMRDLMKRLRPNCFEDIVALVALYRPGPLGSGMVDDFILRKRGDKDIVYDFPQLEPILNDTYGVIVYQEQVMQISSVLANYTLGEADLLRRAMGKKKAEEMDSQRIRFLDGAKANKLDLDKAGSVFDLMALFAEYGFNKSHSAAYALVSYQTAFLKTHYCTEYMAAIMSTEMDDTDKLLVFIHDMKQHGLTMLPPDVNISVREFAVEKEKHIRYGLGGLKGVGTGAIESIVECRENEGPFKSLYDFCLRVDLRRVTKKVIDVLIKAGAFDFLEMPKKGLCEAAENIVGIAVRCQKNKDIGQDDLFASVDTESTAPVGIDINVKEDWSQNQILSFEKECFGFYFSGHPLQVFADSLSKMCGQTTQDLVKLPNESVVTIGGTITGYRPIMTKKGKKMAFAQLEDLCGSIEIIIFSRAFAKYGEILTQDQPLIIKGNIDRSDEGDKILVESIEVLTEKLKNTTRSIHLDLTYQDLTQSKVHDVMGILKNYQGSSLVRINITKQPEFEAEFTLPNDCRAMACEPLQHQLNQLFDRKVVRFA